MKPSRKGKSPAELTQALIDYYVPRCRAACKELLDAGLPVHKGTVFKYVLGSEKEVSLTKTVAWVAECLQIIAEHQKLQIPYFEFQDSLGGIPQAKLETFLPIVQAWISEQQSANRKINCRQASLQLKAKYPGFPTNLKAREWAKPIVDEIENARREQKGKQLQPQRKAKPKPTYDKGFRIREIDYSADSVGRCPYTKKFTEFIIEQWDPKLNGWVRKLGVSADGRRRWLAERAKKMQEESAA